MKLSSMFLKNTYIYFILLTIGCTSEPLKPMAGTEKITHGFSNVQMHPCDKIIKNVDAGESSKSTVILEIYASNPDYQCQARMKRDTDIINKCQNLGEVATLADLVPKTDGMAPAFKIAYASQQREQILIGLKNETSKKGGDTVLISDINIVTDGLLAKFKVTAIAYLCGSKVNMENYKIGR